MRIAFLLGSFPALSETFVLNQITGLIERGHVVDIYAEFPRAEPFAHPAIAAYALLERTRYQSMPASPLLRVLALSRWLAMIVRHPRLALRALNVFKYGAQAASLWLLYASAPFGGGKRYDILHCHFGANGVKGARLREIGALEGKLITAFHGDDITVYPKRFGQGVYAPLFANGDLFLPISARWNEDLIALGCDPQKIVPHPMGVDCEQFSFRPRGADAAEPVRIVSVARWTEMKGIEYGIQAVTKLVRAGKKIAYEIAGEGPLRGVLERMIRELNVSDRVQLLGSKDQRGVIDLLQRADIFLAPSVTVKQAEEDGMGVWIQDALKGRRRRALSAHHVHEGIPVAIMEAMATGLPVVSTLHSGIPGLVREGVTGFLVPERDVDALADRIGHLAERAELRVEMGRQGRAFVERNHNIHQLNDRLVEIYRGLLR